MISLLEPLHKLKPEHIVGASVLLLFPILGLANLFYWKVRIVVTLAYLATSIGVALLVNPGAVTRPHWYSTLTGALVFLIIVGHVRSIYTMPYFVSTNGVMVTAVVYIMLYIFAVVVAGTAISARSVVVMMLGGYVVINWLNITLWLLGVENTVVMTQSYNREFFSLFDFLGARQVLPLNFGYADSSLISAIGGLSALAFLKWPLLRRTNKALRLVLLLSYAVGFVGILLAGNRWVFIAFVAITFIMLARDRFFQKRNAVALAACLYLFPIIYVAIFPLIENSGMLDFLAELSRTGNVSELLTLSNRVFIWDEVILHSLQNDSALWFGYGALGQVVSGVSIRYMKFFEGAYMSPILASPHSAMLQFVVDIGVTGAVLFLLVMLLAFHKARTYHDKQFATPVCMMLFVFATFSAIESEMASYIVFGLSGLFFMAYLTALNNEIKGSGKHNTMDSGRSGP